LPPFTVARGLWKVRAAKGSVGALAYPAHAGHELEWVELDLEGNLIGRWTLPGYPNGGYAYTESGEIDAQFMARDDHPLLVLDRESSTWKPARDTKPEWDQNRSFGLLLGAGGDHLVFHAQPTSGVRLLWFHPSR
jgi:hypothetical protein